ncbi:hypothetical protein [Paraburkholderia haematera]|uniref:hypothetical protein n=1 Tax=Paraburkholderia haematera TaxID=2793077 RepID=UPI001B8AF2E1|nr:hypothetical protein [Paraburkholderia haematera]
MPVSNVTAANTPSGFGPRGTAAEVSNLSDMTRRDRWYQWDGGHVIPRRSMNQIDFSARLMRHAHILHAPLSFNGNGNVNT